MRNHTTPKLWELSGPQGKAITFGTSTSSQVATFQMFNIPTGKDGSLFYYCTGITLAVEMTVNNPTSEGGVALNGQVLYQAVQSLQVYTPILGTLFTHANSRGTVMGNIV